MHSPTLRRIRIQRFPGKKGTVVCHSLNHWQILHFRRVAQKVCYEKKLRQNKADLHLCVDRLLFPALDVQRQVVEVVAVDDFKDFKEGEEVWQLLPNLTISLSLVKAYFSASQFIKLMIDQRGFFRSGWICCRY